MTDLRLTFIDLWWPQILAFWNLYMMYIKRRLSTQGYHLWQHSFSALDNMTTHDHYLTSPDLFGPWKFKNWKSTEYRHVAYQITIKICPEKWETNCRQTFIDFWWPQNLCIKFIKRKLGTQGFHLWQPIFSALDQMTSHDHDFTFLDLRPQK